MLHTPVIRSVTEALDATPVCVCGKGIYDLSVHDVTFEVELEQAHLNRAKKERKHGKTKA